MPILKIDDATVFYKLEADALPDFNSYTLGDLLIDEDGDNLEYSRGQSGWFKRGSSFGNSHVSLPQNASGVLSVNEIKTPVTTAAKTTLFFPNGLTGFKARLFQAGTAAKAKIAYIAFNNRAQNDVSQAGLRHLITLSDPEGEGWTFNGPILPTEVYLITDAGETADGDTVIYYEGVQQL